MPVFRVERKSGKPKAESRKFQLLVADDGKAGLPFEWLRSATNERVRDRTVFGEPVRETPAADAPGSPERL